MYLKSNPLNSLFRWKERKRWIIDKTTSHLVCLFFFTIWSKRVVSFKWNNVVSTFRVLIQAFCQSSIWSSIFYFFSIAVLIDPKLLILCNFIPEKTSTSALNFSAFFIVVLDFGFMQIDPQLTNKLLIFFNFISDFNQLDPQSSAPFSKWSLAVNFFNLTPKWP